MGKLKKIAADFRAKRRTFGWRLDCLKMRKMKPRPMTNMNTHMEIVLSVCTTIITAITTDYENGELLSYEVQLHLRVQATVPKWVSNCALQH